MKIHISVLVLIITLFSSCKPIMQIGGFYKKPRFEDKVSLVKVFKDGKSGNLFIPKSLESFQILNDSMDNSLPKLYIFNKDGNEIYSDVSCTWSKISILDSVYVMKEENDSTLKVYELLSFFKQINTETENSDVNQKYDYYIIYAWAKYVPRLSKMMRKDVAKMKEKYKKKNIFFASINYDLQKDWKSRLNSSKQP